MKAPDTETSEAHTGFHPLRRWRWLLAFGCVGLILTALLIHSPPPEPRTPLLPSPEPGQGPTINSSPGQRADLFRGPAVSASDAEPTAERIVATKLAQFAQSRRAFAHALARKHDVLVSEEVETFFDAVESGDWERIEAAFQVINGGDSSAGHSRQRAPELTWIWPAIIDAYGVAEQVHDWPAQELLDYGKAALGALKPGMVYIGGTDNGRWIPELLNDTSDGERHVIITQNGLADATYLDYVRLQYDERLSTLTEEDSQRAFSAYIADAQRRLEHDRQFPNEPKQVRPSEDIRVEDGKVQVSGQAAVMAVNERLLQALMEKNPDLSFAVQESFPMKSTYADALPLGPLMELRARDEQNDFTAERAAQSLAYWQTAAQQVLADPEATASPATLKSWSHDANSAANLLAAHQHRAEAEQAYRLASQLWPGNPEPVAALADLLHARGETEQARAMLQSFDRQYPDQRAHLQTSGSWTLLMEN